MTQLDASDPRIAEMQGYLKAMEGSLGEPDSMLIEYGAVRKMALAVENFNPIHYDEAAAKAAGYRGVVAPWPLLWLVFFNCSAFGLHFDFGKVTVHGQDDYEFHEPMVVGDTITASAYVRETAVKQGKSGLMGLLVAHREFHNQHGQLCAVLRTKLLRR
ncbi:MaoC family dehydratase [Verticiella sediminum]|uniref:MaoC family dehydratase n=1 Tax=Verticiella sediminum TaxID=1247510 RepID=A0A556AFA6_9BURK|nr:MaoC family dehydratase N-terminal domain-containing protein [Verticiella sediminum]TSH91568.1 MaoC family dehydratase [Verticiella sediminum]